jgi:hypothetical protein
MLPVPVASLPDADTKIAPSGAPVGVGIVVLVVGGAVVVVVVDVVDVEDVAAVVVDVEPGGVIVVDGAGTGCGLVVTGLDGRLGGGGAQATSNAPSPRATHPMPRRQNSRMQ